MAIADIDGTILAINNKADIFGKTKDELIGKSGYPYIEPEAGKRRGKVIKTIIKTKKKYILEDKERGQWWRTIFQPIQDENGKVVKFAVYIENITKIKETEADLETKENELAKTEKKYQVIAENMTDLVFQITLRGKFTYVNPVSERYGYKPEEMMGKNFSKLIILNH